MTKYNKHMKNELFIARLIIRLYNAIKARKQVRERFKIGAELAALRASYLADVSSELLTHAIDATPVLEGIDYFPDENVDPLDSDFDSDDEVIAHPVLTSSVFGGADFVENVSEVARPYGRSKDDYESSTQTHPSQTPQCRLG